MSAGELITKGDMVPGVPPDNLLEVIARAVSNPALDVEKLSKLLDVHERIVADQRKSAFMAAMARVAAKMPEIGRLGTSHHGAYSRLEDIDRVVRPIISAEGLSLSFDSAPIDGKVRVTCKLSHAEGWSETKQIDLPIDNSGSKNGAQAIISTVAYGRRALTKMFFNLIESDPSEDTNGENPATLSEEQVRDLEALITEVKADRARFLSYMNAPNLEAILSRDFGKAVAALEAKRKVSQK